MKYIVKIDVFLIKYLKSQMIEVAVSFISCHAWNLWNSLQRGFAASAEIKFLLSKA